MTVFVVLCIVALVCMICGYLCGYYERNTVLGDVIRCAELREDNWRAWAIKNGYAKYCDKTGELLRVSKSTEKLAPDLPQKNWTPERV